MSPTFNAFVRSWPVEPWLTLGLFVTAVVYLRGWLALRRRNPARWRGPQLASFLGGLGAVFLALASPIEPFASLLLQVHMVQHLLLMMVAPPLLWLGAPLFPLLCGLPRDVRVDWVAPLMRARWLRQIFRTLTNPLVAWALYVGMTWLWHTPRAYELALSRGDWHFVAHVCFATSALLFWYPVVRPYPSRPRWPEWMLLPYLLLADVQNTVLAAWLTFSGSVIYPHYARGPRIGAISALDDQAAAGVLMWVPGSVAFLAPTFWIGIRLLSQRAATPCTVSARRSDRRRAAGMAGLPILNSGCSAAARKPPADVDLLRTPLVGRFLRSRHARIGAQIALFVLALLVIYDGLRGPQVTPMNLAGVLPWVHWRGAVVLGLLAVGNIFCFACPFTLPRQLAARWMPAGKEWPRGLRNKWGAVVLTLLFLWAYEAFALWNSPWITAWLVIGYFLGAFVVDSLFRGSSFCKYVCPIGQFNFIQSLVSPWEVKVREAAVCESCQTHECIRGSATAPGCSMHLFQPQKIGNQDCTFCLDCVRACPQENIGVLAVAPAATLWNDHVRSGVGRLSRRADLAALVLVLVFGALANAAGMIAPVVEWQDRLRAAGGGLPQILVTTSFYAVALLGLPLGLVWVTASASRAWGNSAERWTELATRFAFAFVPIGFAMWLAHYSFHLLTSWGTLMPATGRFIADLGWREPNLPLWQCACCGSEIDWLPHLQILILDIGLLVSLYTGLRIAENKGWRLSRTLRLLAPWAALILLVFVVGVWIVLQPMEMRGTIGARG